MAHLQPRDIKRRSRNATAAQVGTLLKRSFPNLKMVSSSTSHYVNHEPEFARTNGTKSGVYAKYRPTVSSQVFLDHIAAGIEDRCIKVNNSSAPYCDEAITPVVSEIDCVGLGTF